MRLTLACCIAIALDCDDILYLLQWDIFLLLQRLVVLLFIFWMLQIYFYSYNDCQFPAIEVALGTQLLAHIGARPRDGGANDACAAA